MTKMVCVNYKECGSNCKLKTPHVFDEYCKTISGGILNLCGNGISKFYCKNVYCITYNTQDGK